MNITYRSSILIILVLGAFLMPATMATPVSQNEPDQELSLSNYSDSELTLRLAIHYRDYLLSRSATPPSTPLAEIEKGLIPGEHFKEHAPKILDLYQQAQNSNNLERLKVLATFYYNQFIENINGNESLPSDAKRMIMKTSLKLYRNEHTLCLFLPFILKFFMITSHAPKPQQSHKELSLLLEQFNNSLNAAYSPSERNDSRTFVSPEEIDDFTSSLYLYGIPKIPPTRTWWWVSNGMKVGVFIGLMVLIKKLYDVLNTGHETVNNADPDKVKEIVTIFANVLSKDSNATLKAIVDTTLTKCINTNEGRNLIIETVAQSVSTLMEKDIENRHKDIQRYIDETEKDTSTKLTPKQKMETFKHALLTLPVERVIDKFAEKLNEYPNLRPLVKDLLITFVQQSKLVEASMEERAIKTKLKEEISKPMGKIETLLTGITDGYRTFRSVQKLAGFWQTIKISREKLKEKPLSSFEVAELQALQKEFEDIRLISDMVSLAVYWDKNSASIKKNFNLIKPSLGEDRDSFEKLNTDITAYFQTNLSSPPTKEEISQLSQDIESLTQFFTSIEALLKKNAIIIPYPLSARP